MSFRQDNAQLENDFALLRQQAHQTAEMWNDDVQRRFFAQFVDNLPQELNRYLTELNKLDKTFDVAEQTIHNL